MKAIKKKKKLYQNGGETDPPKKGKTRAMGLTRSRYNDPVTVHTPRTQNQRGPYTSEKIKSGELKKEAF